MEKLFCQCCGCEIDGSFGSGRFCSRKCCSRWCRLQGSRKGGLSTKIKREKTQLDKLNKILSNQISSSSLHGNLKDYLFKFQLKEKRCECCGLSTWVGRDIPTQLHHIDGNHENNSLENLQILCPNCHAQTDTYGYRNMNRKLGRIKLE